MGTEAVYQLVHAVLLGRFTVKDAHRWEKIDSVVQHTGALASYSTQAHPKLFRQAWGKRDAGLKALAQLLENAAEAFKHLRLEFGKPLAEPKVVNQVKYFGPGSRCYYPVTFGTFLAFRGAAELTNRVLLMARGHLDYLVGALLRLSNSARYYSYVYADKALKAIAIREYISGMAETAARARRKNAYYVARAFHKARTLLQMRTLASELPGAYEAEAADYVTDGLAGVLHLADYERWLSPFTVLERLELAHLYKWMPSPDFDPTAALPIVAGYHANARQSGADPGASDQMRELYHRVRQERLYHTAVAAKRMTGEYPDCANEVNGRIVARNLDPDAVTPFLLYQDLGKDIVSQVKDKSTVAALADTELRGATPQNESNYLLWYMSTAGQVDTVVAKRQLASGAFPEENYARAAYKAESHKPDSRMFFMLPPITRTILGEFEGNLAKVAEHYPGSLMGKSSAQKSKILAEIMDVHTSPADVPPGIDHTVYVVTFDLSKFSPKSNYNVTRDYHDYWAKVYGRPDLAALSEIGTKGRIIHTQHNVKLSYQNSGADLEGMRGRMMTMFHADMLGAACRLAVERGIVIGRSVLAVFIDDGALKVAIAGSGSVARANVGDFLVIMKEVYASAGQDNHPSKTVVSKEGGEMLAEFYYRGLKVPVGLKAFQRVYPDFENMCSTLPEEADSIAAAVQGALKDGMHWIPAYHAYLEGVVKVISRWVPDHFSITPEARLGLKLLTPKSLGGFGACSIQSLVSTAAINATSEGLGMLNSLARQVPTTRQDIMRIVTMPVVIRDPLSILRDPLRVRTMATVMVENRLTMAVVKWLSTTNSIYSTVLGLFQDGDLIAHATEVAKAMLSGDNVNVPALVRAWKATPLSFVESIVGKVKRSNTIIKLLGHHMIANIRRKNREEVVAVLTH